jgi:hypothetical protein
VKVSWRRLALTAVLLAAGWLIPGGYVAGRSDAGPERSRFERVYARDVRDVLTIEKPAGLRPGERPTADARIPLAVVVTKSRVWVLDDDGESLRHLDVAATAGAAGDVDGDGRDEILVAATLPARVIALDTALRPLWQAPLDAPARRMLPADFEGDGRREVVVADAAGRLTALSPTGARLWQTDPAPGGASEQEARGLDDVRLGPGRKERLPAVGHRGGTFAVRRGDGSVAAEGRVAELRRLRTADLDGDGASELLIGDDGGSLRVMTADGAAAWSWGLGEAVGEIRAFEHDGDPAAAEVVIGGKGGALKAIRPQRGVALPETLWDAALDRKITALAAIDVDGDGRDELFAGTETGLLVAFRADGVELGRSELRGGELQAIRGVTASDGRTLVLAAAGRTLAAHALHRQPAPGWYHADLAFGLAAFVLLVALVAIARFPAAAAPAAPPVPGPDDLAARARAEREARLARLAAHVPPERLNERRAQLAAAPARRPAPPAPPAPPPPPPRRNS